MKNKKHIGDGKLSNCYWVFHYDEKFIEKEDNRESNNKNPEGGLLGEFKTWREALECINTKAYLPHITIEDGITGIVYESYYVICPCCEHEEFSEIEDIKFTKDFKIL